MVVCIPSDLNYLIGAVAVWSFRGQSDLGVDWEGRGRVEARERLMPFWIKLLRVATHASAFELISRLGSICC